MRPLLVCAGAVGVGFAGLAAFRDVFPQTATASTARQAGPIEAMPGITVAKRAPLSLVLSSAGILDCVQKTTLFSKVEWATKLTFVLPEGEFVKKGDLIAELDVSDLREEYGEEQVDVMTAETALAAAEDALLLQRIENENLLATARLNKELADLSLDGYIDAEYPYKVRDLERQIAAAEDALHTAQEQVQYIERLHAKGYRQAVEVAKERLALSKAERAHSDLVETLRVLEQHHNKRDLASLKGAAGTASDEMTRMESLAEMKLAARQVQINNQRRRLLRQKQQFQWATRMLKECKIYAPHDGQVVYPAYRETSEMIAEGATVKFLQPIAVIPNREAMKVTVRVHETQRRLLNPGLPAEVRTDANPRQPFSATVVSISQFPVSGRYPNYDLREYEVVVQLDPGQPELTPGLTAKVDLIAASKDDALQVPFDAVTEVSDSYLVFVREGDRDVPRQVTLGERSEDHVEILSGLDAGERIVLDPRERCADELIAWENSRPEVLQTATVLGE